MIRSRILPWPPEYGLITIDASQVVSGVLDPHRLGSGTPAVGSYVDGSGAWTVLPGGGGGGGSVVPLRTNWETVASSGNFSLAVDTLGAAVAGAGNGPPGFAVATPYFKVPVGITKVRLRAQFTTWNSSIQVKLRILGYQYTLYSVAGLTDPNLSTYSTSGSSVDYHGQAYQAFVTLGPVIEGSQTVQTVSIETPIWDVVHAGDMFAVDCLYGDGSKYLDAFSIEGWP